VNNTFEEQNYPPLFQDADRRANQFRRLHEVTIAGYLVCAIAFSAFATLGAASWLKVGQIVAGLVAMLLTVAIAFARINQHWYRFRAVAESVKSMTWRFMMAAEPYHEPDEAALSQFSTDIRTILNANDMVRERLTAKPVTYDLASDVALTARTKSVEEKLSLYRKFRIDDQLEWYKRRTRANTRAGWFWFGAMVVLLIGAITSVVLELVSQNATNATAPMMLTVSSAVLTWTQMKRFQELGSAYSLTFHEIVLLQSGANGVETRDDLSEFVKDAENAFSREHTQWAARRDAVVRAT